MVGVFLKSIIVLSVLKYLDINHYRVPCYGIFPVQMINDHKTSKYLGLGQ